MSECAWCGNTTGHEPLCIGAHTIDPPRPAVAAPRPTSVETLIDIEAEGLVAGQRLEVWRKLRASGPMTGRELDASLAREGETRTSYHKRLPELRDAGLVAEDGERRCTVTGRNAIVWRALEAPARLVASPRVSRLEALARAFEEEPGRSWTGNEVAAVIRSKGRAA